MNWAIVIVEGIPALAVVLGLVFGFGRWSSEIKANTKATNKLTESFDKETAANRHQDIKLENHETRLTVTEKEILDLKYHKH